MYSMEEEVLKKAVTEVKFNAKILPANLEDLEMKTLIVCIGSTIIGLLDRIKKNTGSNANPVSLQVIKGGDEINTALKKNLDLKDVYGSLKKTDLSVQVVQPVVMLLLNMTETKYLGLSL